MLMQKLNNKKESDEERNTSFKKILNVGRIIKNIVCWLLIAVLTLAVIVFVFTKISGGTPVLFGYTINRIISGSMEPELGIGDVIISKEVTDTSDLSVGDIITFKGDKRFDNQKVTHRVLVTPYNDGNGGIVLVTKGDANVNDDGEINYYDVESKCIAKVDFLRDVYNFFFSKWGLIIFIVLLLLIFFDEIMNIVRLSVSREEEEETESFKEILERVKREQAEASKADGLQPSEQDQAPAEDREDSETYKASSSAENAQPNTKPEKQRKKSKKTTENNKQNKPKSKDKPKQQKNKQKNANSGKASGKKKSKKKSKKSRKR